MTSTKVKERESAVWAPHPLCRAQVQSIQEPLGDLQQSISGPLTEPVDGGAVDQRRVLEEPLSVGEGLL